MFLSQLLMDSCLDSSKNDSTEDFAGDGQECDSSPIVTDLEVVFLRDIYNEAVKYERVIHKPSTRQS